MKTNYRRGFVLFFMVVSALFSRAQRIEVWHGEIFKIDTLAPALAFPWEITYGPDDSIWVTETRGYKIKKVNPRTKGIRTVINLSSYLNFDPNTVANRPQGGLMGLAIHPQLLTGKPYVYVAMVYYKYPTSGTTPDNSTCSGTTGNHPCYYKTKIIRFTYNLTNGSLQSPQVVIDDLFGSNDHNSGRLAIGPDLKLYYSIGDMGAGQFNNQLRTNNAQNPDVYEGKILRLNTEPDGDANDASDPYNKWIPNDNPFTHSVTGKRLATYSFGHRNAQGLVWGNVGSVDRLYSSEHGDKSDDEVNIIEAGRNYGWPKVAGLCDNNYTTHDASTNNNKLANQNIGYEDTFCLNHNVKQPMFGLMTAAAAAIPADGTDIFTWPTVAPSSIDFYHHLGIPGWQNSLLVTSLKYGMFRLKLNASGDAVDSSSTPTVIDTIPYFHGYRIRDIAIAPMGDTLFLAIDSAGNTSGPTGGFGTTVDISTPEQGNILRAVILTPLALKEMQTKAQPHNNNAQIWIYPNPASKIIFVETDPELHKPLRAQLFDMTGRLVMTRSYATSGFSLDVSSLRAGMYVLQVFSSKQALLSTEKILIQH
jgi:aldose sugar dehydrogenase